MDKRYESAAASYRRMTALQPSAYAYLAACLAQMGSRDEAQEAMTEFLRWLPNWTVSEWATQEPFKHDADLQHLLEGLRKAGLPE
jgi:tetratricopeptide (TPR) repeat protein